MRAGLARFRRNRKGATVVEFALLAFPFILLVFAVLESCICFAAQEYMQNITDDLARQLRTGQIRRTISAQDFRDKVCERLEFFVSDGCPGLNIDLRNFTTFEDASKLRVYITSAGNVFIDGGAYQFDPGTSQSKNVLRLYYHWPVLTDIMRKRIYNLSDGTTLMFSTAVWQNEPFDD
ncbi:MAG: pilus assembly protein [Rhizobiales bacterium]|nr:pilus assembly protein [Hyphomicrobiales bacterium]